MDKNLTDYGSSVKKFPLLQRIKNHPYNFIIAILIICNITLILINMGIWIMAAKQKLFLAADFTSFYTGYYMVRIGAGANLYDPAYQASYQEQFMGGAVFFGGVLLFANPPFVAVIFSPISLLPLNIAFYFWFLVQLVLLIWALRIIYRLFLDWSSHERIILFIAILAYWPLVNDLMLGQFSLLLLIGILQIYIGMKNSQFIRGGLGFLLLAIKPHTLLIPGMMILNKRYWRVAIAATIGGVIIFIFTSIFLGVRPWIQFAQNLLTMSTFFGKLGVEPNSQYTLRGVISNFLGNAQASLTNIISIVILIVGMIAVWLLWLRGVAPDSSKYKLYFAFTVILSVFSSLHLYTHDALILVFPAAIFYDYLRQNNYPRKAYSILVLISPLIFFISAFSKSNFFGVIRPPVVIIFVVLIWTIYYLRKQRQMDITDDSARVTPIP
jgi:hypothetical protein